MNSGVLCICGSWPARPRWSTRNMGRSPSRRVCTRFDNSAGTRPNPSAPWRTEAARRQAMATLFFDDEGRTYAYLRPSRCSAFEPRRLHWHHRPAEGPDVRYSQPSADASRRTPDDLRVSHRLDLTDCRELSSLPMGLRVGWTDMPRGTPTGGALILRRCTALESLPDDLDVCYLLLSCYQDRGDPRRV